MRIRIRIILGSYIQIRIRVESRIFILVKRWIQVKSQNSGCRGSKWSQWSQSRITLMRSRIPIRIQEKSWMRIHQHQSKKSDSDSHQGDADPQQQCCGSGMFIPDPDFYPSRIPDLGSKNSNKWEGWKKYVVITFYVATNFTKLQITLVLTCSRKKFGPIFKEL